ncbi:MAG: phage virion morphogenesis protein [Candidatus Aminicenantes bacterium]|nr:phage virion morphogenesis protein [Candidatus Aminicenantes bacterium]
MHVAITSDLSTLDRMEGNLSHVEEALESIGAYMEAETILIFENEGPPGARWPDLEDATWDQKTGSKILQEQGPLKAGITFQVEGDTVYIGPSGTALPYSRIQQKGGFAGRGRQVYIPARKYLVITQGNKTYIRGIVQDYIWR